MHTINILYATIYVNANIQSDFHFSLYIEYSRHEIIQIGTF